MKTQNLSLGYGERTVVGDLSLELPTGRITMIVGPNACGKSTFLRGLARLLPPLAGAVLLDGRALAETPSREIARKLGILPQGPIAPDGITVGDLVGRGRHPHQGLFRRWNAEDDAAVTQALEATGTLELTGRAVDELSGGQRQRVWIAMALAQRTKVLLLDEPTTYLDVSHQVEVLDLLTDLNQRDGTTIVAVLHDLNLACRYADHLIVMKNGAVVVAGEPGSVVTASLVEEVFGMPCRIVPDPVSRTPMIVPIGRHHVFEENQ
ncbi:ABC transporter ATP-binding protein [Actinoplanes couchii]|uniref:Iron-dicitrate ABC transporter ATP-binding protein n=1 Tax=Actinoplanes couchii TaxID=403638 RepID=A0ABQ3X7Y0_9ACTN|nr:ABC transporter ATP-binding protein [Actinoplanes couchii]MDR6320401.1 iron complex transport system ATP-binding protein [Actinoplanes couchii]GID54587.1 iron-dicitrate ABC transporter ATP-binding protein [Actinoplanes couchii]